MARLGEGEGVSAHCASETMAGNPAESKVTRQYLLWLGGLSASLAGDAAMYFALAWVAAGIGGSAAGLVLTALVLPRVLLPLLGGAFSDRYGVRTLMIVCDGLMVVFTLVAAAVVARWGAPLWALLFISAFIGVVNAFYLPASGAMPRLLVPEPAVPRALSMRQTVSNLMQFVGPPLGGLILALGGLALILSFNAATFVLVLVVLLRVVRMRDRAERRAPISLLAGMRDGLALARSDRTLLSSLVVVAGAAAFLLPVVPLLVPLLARSHGWTAADTGLVVGVFGAFNSVVALAVLTRNTFARPGIAAAAGVAVAGVGVVLLGSTGSLAASVVGASVAGLGTGLFATHIGPLILRSTPKQYLARIQGLNLLVQSLPLLVANNLFGALSDRVGPGVATLACGVLSGVVGAYGLLSKPLRGALFS